LWRPLSATATTTPAIEAELLGDRLMFQCEGRPWRPTRCWLKPPPKVVVVVAATAAEARQVITGLAGEVFAAADDLGGDFVDEFHPGGGFDPEDEG
jgi:hypothetical protein